MENPTTNPRKWVSVRNIKIPFRQSRPSEATVRFNPDRNLTFIPSVESTQASQCDPLKILIPMTDAVLVITAIIFIVALGIVALIVIMAIIKNHFSNEKVGSIWTDDWS